MESTVQNAKKNKAKFWELSIVMKKISIKDFEVSISYENKNVAKI